MPLSLDEQRIRGAKHPEERRIPPSWVSRNVTRRLSPYVTWMFLRLGVSANACTALRFLLLLGHGVLIAHFEPVYWLLGVPLGYVVILLDAVDGELARTNGTAGPQGAYLEMMMSQFAQPFLLACGTIGLFRGLGGLHVLVVGLGAVLGAALVVSHAPAVWSAAWESGKPRRSSAPDYRSTGALKLAETAAKVVLMTPGLVYLPQLLVTSLLDELCAPTPIMGFPVNARLLWLALLATGTLGATVLRVLRTVRSGIDIWL